MKGMIFCDFLEMVDDVFSPEMVENIIESSDLPNEGAYTDIGTYDYQELVRLVTHLSKATSIPIPQLEVTYGKYLFTKLLDRYSDLIKSAHSTFEFLQQVDEHIHVEVLKLYPEAELPRFECTIKNPQSMMMEYRSNHPFADLAEGLILGCSEHFNEQMNIQREKLAPKDGKKNVVLFTLSKQE